LGCFPWQKYLLTAEITAKPISNHTAGNWPWCHPRSWPKCAPTHPRTTRGSCMKRLGGNALHPPFYLCT
jgi:hypothetical protein